MDIIDGEATGYNRPNIDIMFCGCGVDFVGIVVGLRGGGVKVLRIKVL